MQQQHESGQSGTHFFGTTGYPQDALNGSTCPVVAAFDFDGTLARGDSVIKFLIYLRGRARVVQSLLVLLPLFVLSGIDGDRYADRFKQRLFSRIIAGMTMEELLTAGERFAKIHLDRKSRSSVVERLAWHRDQGHSVIVVSASPECYIGPAAKLLGATDAIATKFYVDEYERVDGSFQGGNCRGAEKARRLREWIDTHFSNNGQITLWAYGNSLGDRDMLSMADTGINVGRLGRMGRLRKFYRMVSSGNGIQRVHGV